MATRLWRCEIEEHPGVKAPERMKPKDLRRFCLDCSIAAGELVERTCVAAETRRRVKAARRRARSEARAAVKQTARQKESARRGEIRKLLRRARDLQVWQQHGRVARNRVLDCSLAVRFGADEEPVTFVKARDKTPGWEIGALPEKPIYQVMLEVLHTFAGCVQRALQLSDDERAFIVCAAADELWGFEPKGKVAIIYRCGDRNWGGVRQAIAAVFMEQERAAQPQEVGA